MTHHNKPTKICDTQPGAKRSPKGPFWQYKSNQNALPAPVELPLVPNVSSSSMSDTIRAAKTRLRRGLGNQVL